MKALTIKQPWVHAILHEGKDIENRSWRCSYRGWLAIHAAKSPSKLAVYPRGIKLPNFTKLDYSAIVAVVQLVDVREKSRSKWCYRLPRGEKNFAWVIGKVCQLKPVIPCKGALGLWNVPPKQLALLRKQQPQITVSGLREGIK